MNNENNSTEIVVSTLKDYGWKISAAESCTAGLFTSEIASVPGASEVLEMSFVTYSEDAKTKFVGVDPANIEKYGVVSEEVAIQMAIGAAMQAHAEVGVGITGYAGPTGGDEKASVGTICIGLYIDGTVFCKTLHSDVTKGRNVVRQEIVTNVMETLSEQLENFRPYYQSLS